MNEGHAAFLTLELIRERLQAGLNLPDAIAQTRAECIFTTHTPVEAGHDRFSRDLMDYAMHRYRAALGIPLDELLKLGRVKPAMPRKPFA
jgi:starch phosphorylase